MDRKEVLKAWKERVCLNAEKIDASVDKMACWHSLFIGFCLGLGLTLEEATDYSFYMKEALPLEAA
jgi:uncharacterized protein YfaA (DUF2138 family)